MADYGLPDEACMSYTATDQLGPQNGGGAATATASATATAAAHRKVLSSSRIRSQGGTTAATAGADDTADAELAKRRHDNSCAPETYCVNCELLGMEPYTYVHCCVLLFVPYGTWLSDKGCKKPTPTPYTYTYTCTYMPHAACRMPHAACHMPHATCHMPHAAYRMPHATCHMPHAACHMPHAVYRMPHATCHMLEPHHVQHVAMRGCGVCV